MKLKLLAGTCMVCAFAAPAMAVDVELYGQVNKSLMVFDDGRDTETNIVDNNLASTVFGLAGEQLLDNGLTASALFEAYMTSNNSNSITQNTTVNQSSTPTSGATSFSESYARVGLSGNWGAFFIGQQDTAIDDAFYHDLAAAADVMGPGFSSHGGNLAFRSSVTGAIVTLGGANATPNGFNMGFDGTLEQQDSLRYNSPTWNGVNFSASTSQGGDIDATVRYSGKHDAFEVDSAFGYAWQNSSATASADKLDTFVNASVSIKHDSGLAATVAYAAQELELKTTGNDDPTGYYFKVGYAWDNFGVAADWAQFDDGVTASATDHELTAFGLGAQYDMGHGVSTGALYRNYSADITGTSTDDINVYALNLKVKF